MTMKKKPKIYYKATDLDRYSLTMLPENKYRLHYPKNAIVKARRGTVGIMMFKKYADAREFCQSFNSQVRILRVEPLGRKKKINEIAITSAEPTLDDFYNNRPCHTMQMASRSKSLQNEYTIDAVVTRDSSTFLGYQKLASKTAIYNGRGRYQGLTYCSMGLAGEVGELLNKIKKLNRDERVVDFDVIADDLKSSLKNELGDILWYWSQICHELDVNPNDIAADNIEKLKKRSEQNKLKGSGDER
jgi:NTP pyrophosphatase (non-canonical NTP hydrolase)